MLSGTILLNDTPQTLHLLEEWKKRSEINPDVWDQVVLQEILDQDQALLLSICKQADKQRVRRNEDGTRAWSAERRGLRPSKNTGHRRSWLGHLPRFNAKSACSSLE
jgi:hypothetical protein